MMALPMTLLRVQNSMRHRWSGKFGPCDKAHKRPEALRCRSPHKIHPRQGGLKSFVEYRESINALDPFQNLRRQKRITFDVDSVSRSQEHMIEHTLGSIVQLNAQSFPFCTSRNDKTSRMDAYIPRARLHPARHRG